MVLVGYHRATVVHGRCLEHGEELHLERIGAEQHVADAGFAQLTASGWALHEGDQHCEILATAGAPAIASPAPTAHHVAIASDAAPIPDTAAPPRACELLRIAPKTSPPAFVES